MKYLRTTITIAVVVLIFLFAGLAIWHFSASVFGIQEKANQQRLKEISQYNAKTVKSIFETQVGFVEGIANQLARYEGITGNEALEFLKIMSVQTEFSQMSIELPDNTSYSLEGIIEPNTDLGSLIQALDGKTVITSGVKSFVDDQDYVAIYAPIVKGNRTVGALRAMYSTQRFNDIIYQFAFDGKGLNCIIDQDGNFIDTSTNKLNFVQNTNLFKGLAQAEFERDYSLAQIQQSFDQQVGGFAAFTYQDKALYAYYQPIGMNNWFVLTLMPKSMVAQTANLTEKAAYLLCAELAVILICLALYLLYQQVKRQKMLTQAKKQLEKLTANIDGGLITCKIDPEQTLTYLSAGFYELTGYSPEETKSILHQQKINLIYSPDREHYQKVVAQELHESAAVGLEYRIEKKNGIVIWVLERGNLLVDHNGEKYLQSVLIDVTEKKNLEEKIRSSEELYRLTTEQAKGIIFEYSILDGKLSCSEFFERQFGYPCPGGDSLNQIAEGDIVHPDDLTAFEYLFKYAETTANNRSRSSDLRIKRADGEYLWCRVSTTVMLGTNQLPCRIIGRIDNIDQEKKKILRLEQKSIRDPLTKIYNKETLIMLIDSFLESSAKDVRCALFSLDIDNFKGINDNFGHLFGDKVIVDIAETLQSLFRTSDIVGRFGGDEFVVFIQDIPPEEFIIQKANVVCEALRRVYEIEGSQWKISCSIGVVINHKNGKSFKELYSQADTALYQAKKEGKDRVCIYQH